MVNPSWKTSSWPRMQRWHIGPIFATLSWLSVKCRIRFEMYFSWTLHGLAYTTGLQPL